MCIFNNSMLSHTRLLRNKSKRHSQSVRYLWSSLAPYFVNPKSKVLHNLCFRYARTFSPSGIYVEQMCRPLIPIWWHFPVYYLVCRVWASSKPLLILIIGYFYTKLHNKYTEVVFAICLPFKFYECDQHNMPSFR